MLSILYFSKLDVSIEHGRISIRARFMLADTVVPDLFPSSSVVVITQFHGSLCLGRKKMYEQQRDQILGTQFNVDSLAGAQEQVGSGPGSELRVKVSEA